MGQSSIPTLNRNGYSMFWLSSWDDLHSYSTNLNEDAFIRSFFYYMVNDKYSSNFFFSKNNIIEFSKNTSTSFLKNTNKNYLSDFLFRFNKLPYYISKIRILKFQKWLIVYFYIYNYNKKISLSKNNFYNLLKFQKKNNFYFLKKNSNFLFDF